MQEVAYVELYRDPKEQASGLLSATMQEEVRGFREIQWQPKHVVFLMNDGTSIAYYADRVHELVTVFEEE